MRSLPEAKGVEKKKESRCRLASKSTEKRRGDAVDPVGSGNGKGRGAASYVAVT
jgi:hypothetical protein